MTTTAFTHPSVLAAVLTALPPFLAFVLIMLFLQRHRVLAAALAIGTSGLSLCTAVYLLVRHGSGVPAVQYQAEWLVSGNIKISAGAVLDPTSIFMLCVVTVICFLVQVYSLGYMAKDPGFSRYYAYMAFFEGAMTALVLSPSLLQLYVFWELVGLASYLLIGFWYEKFSASEAGKKAFVMTRLGDVAFLLGMLVLLSHLGNLDINELNSAGVINALSPGVLTMSVLLIFGGIIGKSAQFPLLTWLPDAMEGPTPVSALLHSATMVAAGVFLFARLFPLFSASSTAMSVCLAIGTISMLLTSTMAMVSRDIKKVWAYSTISQLGFMIMGLAAGGFVAGTFHLTTHAGFKALLFLCSGVFIHHYNTNDIFEMSRMGAKSLKIPMFFIIIAAAALAGIPPFSGFFSKELILMQLSGLDNPLWLAAGVIGAILTSYYSFRLIFILLRPGANMGAADRSIRTNSNTHGHHHDSRSEWLMGLPLLFLALVTVSIGFFQDQFSHLLSPEATADAAHAAEHISWLPFLAVGLCVSGALWAWVEYGRRGSAQIGIAERLPVIRALFAERWYMDKIYRWLLDHVIYGGVSRACATNDKKVIDGSLDSFARGAVDSGKILSKLHMTNIQAKLMSAFVIILLLALYSFFEA
ncbi:MAG: NADH-quinone oxidoreductase subunit L [Desulfobacteraceae bacterium]|nr:NADH-quinone oxidoreductase subunit L [Desulfobacteraceae bacterium]